MLADFSRSFRRRAMLRASLVLALVTLACPQPVVLAQHDGHVTVSAEAGAHGEERGPIEWRTDLALWSLISFLLILLILSKFAWPVLSQGLYRREQRIRDDIGAAEQARRKAEAMLAEHEGRLEAVQEEVRAILAEARRDADVARQNIISDAQREAAAERRRAIEEINRAKDQALAEMFGRLNERVVQATEHVLGRTVNEHDQERLIEEALSQLRRQST